MKEDYDFDGEKLVIKRSENVAPILEVTKAMRNKTPKTGKFHGDHLMHHVATIPAIVANQWLAEGINIFDDSPETRRRIHEKLNGDFAYLKTVNARL